MDDLNSFSSRFLRAVDIIPEDDTYHGNIKFLDIEWWYFDAVFDNGYSIQIGFRTYHIRKLGVLQTRVNIYKKGEPILEKVKFDLFSNFKSMKKNPTLKIKNKKAVIFDKKVYNKNKIWRYNLDLAIDGYQIKLSFEGTTKGWKIETSKTCWTVPLPKAIVKGSLIFKGKKIEVKGTGYHDHNWAYSPTTAMNNLGWFWGRINADKLNLTWAETLKNRREGDLISVINLDKKGFFNVNPKCIFFKTNDFIYNHHRYIPTNFDLKVDDKKTNEKAVLADLNMKMTDIQHLRIFTIHYWRYHVKTNGIIKVGSKEESLKNNSQIIEYLNFKAKNII